MQLKITNNFKTLLFSIYTIYTQSIHFFLLPGDYTKKKYQQ